jgi:hypothetical protein
MSPNTLTIALASDLHAHDADTVRPSHLKISDAEDQPGQHPIAGLLHLIARDSLTADILLCPGDLAHKAKPAAIQYAWRAIHRLGEALGATLVAGTPGNHDLDSRHSYNGFDAKGVLQSLLPRFPLLDEPASDRFWSRHFVEISGASYRLVLLNSCAFHGNGTPEELLHGRISDHTLSALKDTLSKGAPKPINLLVCHHHPQQHMELKLGDYDVLKQGQLLLDLLGSGDYGDWVVIHGHKHHPKLAYASGGAAAPTVFSAGSLCVELYLELQTLARNQFYLLTFDLDTINNIGLCGTFKSWDWATGLGWIMAGPHSGLPPRGGFGFRGNLKQLARAIKGSLGGQPTTWPLLATTHPEIQFLLPTDASLLIKELATIGVNVTSDKDGIPFELGVK